MVGPKHYIVDLCIEDLESSSKVHARAKEREVRYYDCLLFPQPATLASFEKNEPVVLLGGEPLLSDFLRTVLAGLGRLTFTGGSNQSIFFKMILSVGSARGCEIAIHDHPAAGAGGGVLHGAQPGDRRLQAAGRSAVVRESGDDDRAEPRVPIAESERPDGDGGSDQVADGRD